MKEAAARAGATTTTTPEPKPAAQPAPQTDPTVAALQKKLDDTLEELRKANERAAALDGKLKEQGPRTAAELRAARDELKKANERVATLEAEVRKKVDELRITGLSDDERRLAGEDMVKVAAKIAREVVDARLAEVMPGDLVKRVDLLESMSRDAYFLALDEGVPDWERINNDPRFVAWLNQVDPATQRLRMDRIKRAEASHQGHMVVEIFRAFLEKREIGAPKAAEPDPKDTPSGPAAHVDPGPGGGSSVDIETDKDGKRIWTRAEISQHYREKTQGLWRGKEADWRKVELDINAAYRENRIRG